METSLQEGVRHKKEIAEDNRRRLFRKEYVPKQKVEPEPELETESELDSDIDPE